MSINRPQSKLAPSKHRQRGLSLIESLVALLVLALGIMGLAGIQARILAESRTSNSRAVAIGLIDDMTNRILLNRDAAMAGSYASGWGAATTTQDCQSANCTAAQLATSDLNAWRTRVLASLPGANASVFTSANDTRQIGIAVAWTANEGAAQDADGTSYNSPFAVTTALTGVACPANSICHVVYVQP